jgi:iron complex transport system ATP-binding protein
MRYNSTTVLDVGELAFRRGELVSVVGPNGAGKSTLLGVMAGLRDGYEGQCRFEEREVRKWPRREFARSVSFVPQSLRLEFPFTAEQVVMMGRTPYCDGLFEAPEDHAAVERAMEAIDAIRFRHRDFRSLSGGERQRVVLAAALAQEPAVLLLDEPTSFLDIKHQLAMQRILRDLCAAGMLVVEATHDLNLAATYSDRVVVLHNGRVVADGVPRDSLSAEKIRDVFEVDARMEHDSEGGPWIRYAE